MKKHLGMISSHLWYLLPLLTLVRRVPTVTIAQSRRWTSLLKMPLRELDSTAWKSFKGKMPFEGSRGECRRREEFTRQNLIKMRISTSKQLLKTSCTAIKWTCTMESCHMDFCRSKNNKNWKRRILLNRTTLSMKVCAVKPTSHRLPRWALKKSFRLTTRGISRINSVTKFLSRVIQTTSINRVPGPWQLQAWATTNLSLQVLTSRTICLSSVAKSSLFLSFHSPCESRYTLVSTKIKSFIEVTNSSL